MRVAAEIGAQMRLTRMGTRMVPSTKGMPVPLGRKTMRLPLRKIVVLPLQVDFRGPSTGSATKTDQRLAIRRRR